MTTHRASARRLTPLAALALALLCAAPAAAQFTPGNLVVVRIGDGTAALTSAAFAAFLDEYTPGGALVQTIAMPTAPSGANQALTNSGIATSEGNLQLSLDGRYLVAAGYATPPGTAAVAGTTSAAVPRVIARIDLGGAVDTSTALTAAFSATNIRSATAVDGSAFWASGASGGVQYAAFGSSSSIALNAVAPTNTRVCSIQQGQLYVSSASGAFQGVSAVGTGIPTTTGQTITLLSGFPTSAGPSAYDFWFADANTLYVADDRASAAGGIQKWTQSGGTWTLQYTLNPPPVAGLSVGCRAVTGYVTGGVPILFATTAATAGNLIVTAIDAGPTSLFNTVGTAGTNTIFRGLRRIPDRGSIVRNPIGCGPTTIASTGQPIPGGSVTTTLGNLVGLPFLGFGFGIGNVPFCTCTLGHDWAVVLFGATVVLNIPNVPIYIGTSVGIQGADFLGTGGCPSPQITFTDTMVVTIG